MQSAERRTTKDSTNAICIPCREKKKKCEGGFPCRRCVEWDEEDRCRVAEKKARGRPKKRRTPTDEETIVMIEGSEGPIQIRRFNVPIEDDRLRLLSLMLRHGPSAITHSTAELFNCFGLDLGPNFVVAQFPEMPSSSSADPVSLFRKYSQMVESSEIRACVWDGSVPGMDESVKGWKLGALVPEEQTEVPFRTKDIPTLDAWKGSRCELFVNNFSSTPGIPLLRVVNPIKPGIWRNCAGEVISARAWIVIVFDDTAAPKFLITCFHDASRGRPTLQNSIAAVEEATPTQFEMDTDWLSNLELDDASGDIFSDYMYL